GRGKSALLVARVCTLSTQALIVSTEAGVDRSGLDQRADVYRGRRPGSGEAVERVGGRLTRVAGLV
ncbi:MAG TPA: hypothetical protein VN880_12485, partial [Solirubrobacteraceae bacterium]|nr:hypothetical protein [Solirubrobacteraceae bacterium]